MPKPTDEIAGATKTGLCTECGYVAEVIDRDYRRTLKCKRYPPAVFYTGLSGSPQGFTQEWPDVTDDPGCGEWTKR